MNTELKGFADFLRSNHIDDDDIFASRLVSCELITNVIRHSGEAADFKGELLPDKIIVTVTAKSLDGIELPADIPDVFAESGRGLYIVKSFGKIEKSGNGSFKVFIKRSDCDK